MDSSKTIILDIRVPSLPAAELSGHSSCINSLAWYADMPMTLSSLVANHSSSSSIGRPTHHAILLRLVMTHQRSSGTCRRCPNQSKVRERCFCTFKLLRSPIISIRSYFGVQRRSRGEPAAVVAEPTGLDCHRLLVEDADPQSVTDLNHAWPRAEDVSRWPQIIPYLFFVKEPSGGMYRGTRAGLRKMLV